VALVNQGECVKIQCKTVDRDLKCHSDNEKSSSEL